MSASTGTFCSKTGHHFSLTRVKRTIISFMRRAGARARAHARALVRQTRPKKRRSVHPLKNVSSRAGRFLHSFGARCGAIADRQRCACACLRVCGVARWPRRRLTPVFLSRHQRRRRRRRRRARWCRAARSRARRRRRLRQRRRARRRRRRAAARRRRPRAATRLATSTRVRCSGRICWAPSASRASSCRRSSPARSQPASSRCVVASSLTRACRFPTTRPRRRPRSSSCAAKSCTCTSRSACSCWRSCSRASIFAWSPRSGARPSLRPLD